MVEIIKQSRVVVGLTGELGGQARRLAQQLVQNGEAPNYANALQVAQQRVTAEVRQEEGTVK